MEAAKAAVLEMGNALAWVVTWGVVLGVGGALLFGDEVSFVKFSLAGLWRGLAWRCEAKGWGIVPLGWYDGRDLD